MLLGFCVWSTVTLRAAGEQSDGKGEGCEPSAGQTIHTIPQ